MTTAHISIQSTITGAIEGGTDLINLQITNTSAVYQILHSSIATGGIAGAQTFALPSTAVRQVLIVPPSTNTTPYRIGNSTAGTTSHLTLGAGDPTLLSVSPLSTLVLWSTGTTAIADLRIIFF